MTFPALIVTIFQVIVTIFQVIVTFSLIIVIFRMPIDYCRTPDSHQHAPSFHLTNRPKNQQRPPLAGPYKKLKITHHSSTTFFSKRVISVSAPMTIKISPCLIASVA